MKKLLIIRKEKIMKTKIAITLLTLILAVPTIACHLCEKVKDAELIIILDRSGSMESMKKDMQKAVNKFIFDQKSKIPHLKVTLAQFDEEYELLFNSKPIKDVPKIKIKPRGRTALLDAIGQTLTKAIKTVTPATRVIVITITDGLENASTKFTREKVFDKIKHLRKIHNWKFVFLGANQDAIATAQFYNIDYGFNFNASNLTSVVDCTSIATSGYLVSGNFVISEPNNVDDKE